MAAVAHTGRALRGLATVSALVLVALLAPSARAAGVPPPDFSEAVAAGGLSAPIAIAFLPNRDLLVTEQGGALKKATPGGTVTTLTTLPTCSTSEMGLLGVAVDPGFDTAGNGFVYVYRTVPGAGGCGTSTGRFNEVDRLTFSGGSVVGGPTTLLTGIRTDGGNHNGGTLRIGPDNKLYVSVGDTGVGDSGPPGASTNPYAQDLNSLNGKILRLELSGAPAAGNPFIGQAGKRGEIWAYGFRNPFRMSFDPQTGKLWAADVGQSTIEELDIGQSGGNYAWPRCEGSLPAGCQQAGDIDPVFEYPHSGPGALGGCIIGGAFAPSGFGVFGGQYFFGDCNTSKLFRAPANAARDDLAATPVDFVTGAGGPSDLIFGPDGDLYYVANFSGQVRRVTPNYARPQGASPMYAPLVVAYQQCTSPNHSHAPPLAFGSCNPVAPASGNLTVGTPDANGATANSTGSVKLIVGASDVNINASLTDVRCKAGVSTCASANAQDGADYTGELRVSLPIRITDKANTPPAGGSSAGTVTDNFFNVTVPCVATGTSIGGSCAVATTANAVTAGSISGGMRAIWQLGQVQVLDGGPDGSVSTSPNQLFAVQGIFAP